MAGAVCPSCKCMVGEEEHAKDCETIMRLKIEKYNKNPASSICPPLSLDGTLREHIAYLREQLEGKNRWQEEELKRLRKEVKDGGLLRHYLSSLLSILYFINRIDDIPDCGKTNPDFLQEVADFLVGNEE